MIYLLHAWGDDETTLRSVGKRLGSRFRCLRGGLPADGGFAWTSWESEDPREVARARREVESQIREDSVLFGFSQGGMLALEVAFAGAVRVRAVVTVGAYLAPGGIARPRARVHRGPRTLLLHGEADDAVPRLEAARAFERLGPLCELDLSIVPGGHEITPRMIRLARGFLVGGGS